jgi:hypothetical protein
MSTGSLEPAIVAASVGSFLIILNEWVKVFFERKKQRDKLGIWHALESNDASKVFAMRMGAIASDTRMRQKTVESLVYEIIRKKTIFEGPLPGGFTRSSDYQSTVRKRSCWEVLASRSSMRNNLLGSR